MDTRTKILLFSDDKKLSRALENQLSHFAFRTLTSENSALEKVFDEVPHLIVIDEAFNNHNGGENALYIKKDLILKYIPIVFLVENNNDTGILEKRWKADYLYNKKESVVDLAVFLQRILTQNCHELDVNPLTHLPGSRSSVLRVERAVSNQKPFCVCYLDLTALAAYNNVYGISRGDEIIVKLSRIIQEATKKEGGESDFVGHLGGDDFVIVTEPEFAVPISEMIIRHFDAIIATFYSTEDKALGYIAVKDGESDSRRYPIMNISIVIVESEGADASEISELSYVAGELKKHLKTIEGSCYVNYHHKGLTALKEGQGEELRACFPSIMKNVKIPNPVKDVNQYQTFFQTIIQQKKITTVYQPLIDFATKEVIGYEALTRTLPGQCSGEPLFLFGLARESGKLKELDSICVETALKHGQNMNLKRKLFLNINHETLIDPQAMKTLFSSSGKIPLKNIVIEVTEQSILRSFQKMRQALAGLKEQGVSIAIDDLGGGAVSLRDVAILRPDYIKFDKLLIRQIDSQITKQQIILSMILFAKGIQAQTVAEGIETGQEYETVQMLGINHGQGFYIAKPNEQFIECIDLL